MLTNLQPMLARVRSALLRRGRTREDVDDLVHDAWVRMADYAVHHSVADPGAFMMRAALNLAIDEHRARGTRGEEVAMEVVAIVDPAPEVEARILAQERAARLRACVAQLAPRTRSIFVESRFNGMAHAEIARRYGLSVSAVEKQLAKATMLVAGWMQGW